MRITIVLINLFVFASCGPSYERTPRQQGNAIIKFDLQGHRGARGLAPENTIPGFWKALSLGVSTLELDLAVTKDNELIVSHEPWFSSQICSDSTQTSIARADERNFNIYQMSYEEISRFDCGSKQNPNFPEQENVSVAKPKLLDVISSSEQFTEQKNGFPVNYNIEIKSHPDGEGLYHPDHKTFSKLVYETLDGVLDWDRVTIQSFDFRVLQYFNESYPNVRLAALIENKDGVEANLQTLGFEPEIYSCYYQLLDKRAINDLHERGISVIPWTVNEMTDMERLFEWGVDGLITDYPNRFWESKVDPREVIEYQK